MVKRLCAITVVVILAIFTVRNAVYASGTQYTVPENIEWMAVMTKGVHGRYFYVYLRGAAGDKCGQLMRIKFPDGFVYPWHVNDMYGIYTILQGILILGFDKHHLRSAERSLPAGSVVQGLTTEPHYGRAVGETIFDAYLPCDPAVK
ncbi:MAG TPA: hypothetical protein VGI19_14095 [Candidatus Cybelea sp.]|jgi:hypothetical protein